MEQNPDRIFYAYTKSMILFKNVDLPRNFVLIQSEGTKNDDLYLDYNKPFARVFNTAEELNKAINTGLFLDASNSDLQAVKAVLNGLNVALIKH